MKIHAETSERLENQLEAQAEIVKIQGKRIKIQSESEEKHNEQLVALQEKNYDLTVQITSNLETIEAQEMKMNMFQDEMANLKVLLNSKANNTLSTITLAIAIITFLVSIIQFLFFIKS